MTNSELSEYLNNILKFLRDSGEPSNSTWISLKITKPKNATFTTMDSALKKLYDEKHIISVEKEYHIKNSFYISTDGTIFINNGGYNITDKKINQKKISTKWLALIYAIELASKSQKPPVNTDGTFSKNDLIEIGENITGKSGQYFYKCFIQIELNRPEIIARSYGKNWKDEILKLTDNNTDIAKFLTLRYK